MKSLALARKWRPQSFEAVAGQTHVVSALTHALKTQRLHHAYLLTGTRGVGKTSIARLFAKALNCETGITPTPCDACPSCEAINAGRSVDFIEIDAASRSKVEDTREILDNVQYPPTYSRFKIYLIDEIHMLSGHSFNALLKTLEEPPAHVKFLLATTDPKKLPVTVLSRCLQFHLKNMQPHEIITHLMHILNQEKIAYEETALPFIAEAADGSLRDALSLLDQAIAYAEPLQEKNVREMLGCAELPVMLTLLEALATNDAQKILAITRGQREQGVDCGYILQQLQQFFHQLTIKQCVSNYELPDNLQPFVSQISPEDLQLFYQIALKGSQDLSITPTPWIALEMTLLRMVAFRPGVFQGKSFVAPPVVVKNTVVVPENTPSSALRAPSPPRGEGKIEVPLRAPSPPSKIEVALRAPSSPSRIEEKIEISRNHEAADIRWDSLLPQLKLTGMANTVAQYCALQEYANNTLSLHIPQQSATFLTTNIKAQIETAIIEHFAKKQQKITVAFNTTQAVTDSPAAKRQEKTNTALENAKTALDHDQHFQKILTTFQGTIVPNSITLNNEE